MRHKFNKEEIKIIKLLFFIENVSLCIILINLSLFIPKNQLSILLKIPINTMNLSNIINHLNWGKFLSKIPNLDSSFIIVISNSDLGGNFRIPGKVDISLHQMILFITEIEDTLFQFQINNINFSVILSTCKNVLHLLTFVPTDTRDEPFFIF